ncbi:MAG: hypothetical protein WDN28_06035 [Chthoniobacter sp.]
MSAAKKIDPSQEVPFRCLPVSAAEKAASFRLCVAVREHADGATGHLFLLRQVQGARAILGAMCDAGGNIREWLELWIQDVEASASAETLVPSNKAGDKAWELLVARLRGADPEGAFSNVYEKQPAPPVFIDLAKGQPWHPATEAGEIQVCREDAALAAAELPPYSESSARFGRATAGGPLVALNEAARGAKGVVELRALLPAGVELVSLNPGGGMMFARRFAPLGLEEFAELLGGRPWNGLVNARRPFRLHGVYHHLEDETEMRAAGFHFYGSRRNQSGRLAEVLCLKLLLLDQCIREVAGEVRRTGLPLLNLTPDSFRISLGATSPNLPFCWASRVSLVLSGDAVALDIPSSKTRYFTSRVPASASIYRPEELGVPRRGIGSVRLRRVFSPAEGGIAAEGTLTSHERLNVQPNELLRLRLPLKDAGSVELIGYLESKTALAAGEAAFRTIPLLLSEGHAETLRSYEGIPFSQIPFEVLQPLNSPCDLYALGVLGLRLLYAGSDLSLPMILDTALSLLRAASAEPVEGSLEARILALLLTDERWLAALGTPHLVRPTSEGGAVVAGSLPAEVWSRVLASILPFFPGRAPESFCRDFSDGPTLAPHKVFDPALHAIERTLDTVRAMFLSDWTYNEEMVGILSPYLPSEGHE